MSAQADEAPSMLSSRHGSSCSGGCVWAAAWLCHMPETQHVAAGAIAASSRCWNRRGRGASPAALVAVPKRWAAAAPHAPGLRARQPYLSLG